MAGIKLPILSHIPGLNMLLFSYWHNNAKYNKNEILNKFLLAGDKFMPEMHLR